MRDNGSVGVLPEAYSSAKMSYNLRLDKRSTCQRPNLIIP
jgi:hypothetical protein